MGVANFIPDTSDDDKDKNKEETVSNTVVEIEKRVIERKFIPDVTSVDNGDDNTDKTVDVTDGDEDMDWEHNPDPHPHVDPPRPPKPVDYVEGTEKTISAPKEIKPSKFMYICSNPDEGKYMVDFVPSVDSENGSLSFFLSGETEAYKAGIVSASQIGGAQLTTKENTICGLVFKAGQHIRINMQLDFKDYCSMEVKAYVDKK